MGANYTRQSSYTDGDVIQAGDSNNEFDQLLAAFAASSVSDDSGPGVIAWESSCFEVTDVATLLTFSWVRVSNLSPYSNKILIIIYV